MTRRRLPLPLELALVLALAGAALLLATRYAVRPWVVLGPSMAPTLRDGDRVLVDLWTYRHRLPRRGEIALFAGPSELLLVKRIADAPLPAHRRRSGVLIDPTRPGEATFLVAGDNPVLSADSRSFGAVPASRFVGRVIWRYWPPFRLGPI